MAKYFFQYFQSFSIFTYNESFPKKSSQFFKIFIRFYKKREHTHAAFNEQSKTEKTWTLFYLTGYFMTLKVAINHFFFNRSFSSQDLFYFTSSFTAQFLFFDVRLTQEISKGEIGNNKQLGIANYNIYFKSSFNLLVMNATKIIFFPDKSAYMTLN